MSDATQDVDQIRAILDHFSEQLEHSYERKLPWIFVPTPDREGTVALLCAIALRARDEGRKEGAAIMAAAAGERCACFCRVHERHACAKCLRVESCPIHDEASPLSLQPDLLEQPELLAETLYTEAADLAGAAGEAWTFWDELEPVQRQIWTEAARRVVTARAMQAPR